MLIIMIRPNINAVRIKTLPLTKINNTKVHIPYPRVMRSISNSIHTTKLRHVFLNQQNYSVFSDLPSHDCISVILSPFSMILPTSF